MPYKNAEKTITASLKSISDQAYPNFMLVSVNNQSSDSSEDILISFCGENKIPFINLRCEDSGIVPTLNTGLFWILGNGIEKFDAVARLDSDDIWLSGKLQKQVDFLNRNKDISILGTQIETVSDGSGGPCAIEHPINHEDIARTMFSLRNSIAHPSVIVRTEVYRRIGVYDDLYRHSEDYQFWMKASKHFKMANLPDVLVKYSSHYNPNYNPAIPAMCKILYGKAILEAKS